MLNVKQIGNGGAFNFKLTNSSFLIQTETELTLFDCGYSVYQKLRQMDEDKFEDFSLKNLKRVYISHFDDDHIGSLKTLIYYQFFINQIIMEVIVDTDLYQEMVEFLKEMNGVYENYKKVNTEMVKIKHITKEEIDGCVFMTTPTSHHVDCFGLAVYNDTKFVLISGDTRAVKEIEEITKEHIEQNKYTIIYHDFSNWDCPEKQVHMCFSDMERVYSGEFINRINRYHNDDENYIGCWR